MNDIEEINSRDTGRFLRAMIKIEDEGNAEFDMEHSITPYGDGFCVLGVAFFNTRAEAEQLVSEVNSERRT